VSATTRRALLRGAGIAAALVPAGVMWRAWDQGLLDAARGPAYDPWVAWRPSAGEGPRGLVRAAILAANPHNIQPWRFRVAQDRVDLFDDTSRSIGTIDPYRREVHVGLGCALENLLLAARAQGYHARPTLLPDAANPSHVARILLSPAPPAASDLYDAIPGRHTNRGPYDGRPVAPDVLRALEALAGAEPEVALAWYTSATDRRRVGELVVQAAEAIVGDEPQARDSGRWLRAAWRDVQRHRDGITVDAQGMPPLTATVAKLLPALPQRLSDRAWLGATRDVHVGTAAAFGIILVRDARSPGQRIAGGRLWERMHLWATLHGLAMQPLNQILERADREQSLGITPRFGTAAAGLVGRGGWQALMPFRLGYPTRDARPSPRRALSSVLG
jgi:hypothetical protein